METLEKGSLLVPWALLVGLTTLRLPRAIADLSESKSSREATVYQIIITIRARASEECS